MFAALHPSGTGVVYEVEPIGELLPDPDYKGPEGEVFEVLGARVVRRFKISGKDLDRIRRVVMGSL